MQCAFHPDREAMGVCTVCGKGICEADAVPVEGRLYCKDDIAKAYIEKAKAAEGSGKSALRMLGSIFFIMSGIGSMGVLALIAAISAGYSTLFAYPVGGHLSLYESVAVVIFAIVEAWSGGTKFVSAYNGLRPNKKLSQQFALSGFGVDVGIAMVLWAVPGLLGAIALSYLAPMVAFDVIGLVLVFAGFD